MQEKKREEIFVYINDLISAKKILDEETDTNLEIKEKIDQIVQNFFKNFSHVCLALSASMIRTINCEDKNIDEKKISAAAAANKLVDLIESKIEIDRMFWIECNDLRRKYYVNAVNKKDWGKLYE